MIKIKILSLVLGLVAFAAAQVVDLTRTPESSGSEVVKSVVDIIRRSCIFEDDILYLRRVAYVESHDGTDKDTYTPGHNGGIWNVDEATLKSTQTNRDLAKLWDAIKQYLYIDWSNVTWDDLRKPLYSALAAELAAIAHGGIPNTIETQAAFWANNGPEAHTFLVETSKLTTSTTYSNIVDVAFVLDSSASLSPEDFERTKEFVQKVIEGFDIDNNVRIAIVEYSTLVYPQLGLDNGLSKADLIKAVSNLTYIPGGTNTKDALNYTQFVVFGPNNGSRPNAAKVVILVTDGISDDPVGAVNAAMTLSRFGVNTFTVGVGSQIDKTYLEKLASEPKCVHVKTVSNYTDLPAINYELQQLSLQSSIILQPGTYKFSCGDRINAQINAPPQGATVQITTDSGRLNVYGSAANSFTPSSVLYAFNETADINKDVQLYLKDATQLSLAIRNASTDGCTGSYTIAIQPGNLIQLGTHLQCFQSNLAVRCSRVDFNNSPYIQAEITDPVIPNVCFGVSNYFVAPYPGKTDRYVYCYQGSMIIVYCINSQIFDIATSSCINNPITTMLPTTTRRTTIVTTQKVSQPHTASTTTAAPITTAPTTAPTTAQPVTTPATILTNPCTPDNIAQGLFLWPVAGDNTSYIKCDIFPYTGKVLYCEPHHYYSQAQMTCLFSEVVINPTPGNFSSIANPCSLIHDGDVQFHPHPTDPHRYIQCDAFGQAFIKECLGTEVWYQAYLTCIPRGPIVG